MNARSTKDASRRTKYLKSLSILGLYVLIISLVWWEAESRVIADARAEIAQKTSEATVQAQNSRATVLTNLKHLHGVAAIIAADANVERLASIPDDSASHQISVKLRQFATKVNVGVIWVLNEKGRCIAASNEGSPESFIGVDYKDRSYYQAAKQGDMGYQYAVGRKSNIPGLFFSAPIQVSKQFAGAVIVKFDLPNASWVDEVPTLIADHHGVIMLARDKAFERRALPGSDADRLTERERVAIYKQANLESLHYKKSERWQGASVMEIGDAKKVFATYTLPIPAYRLTLTVYRFLNIASNFDREVRLAFYKNAAIATLIFIVVFSFLGFVSARLAATKALSEMAFFDPLTRLPNRRLLVDRVEQALKAAFRSKTYNALIFVDLDNFKVVNDSCGHEGGDELLTKVAAALSSCIRAVDTVARLGGDEFVVLVTGLAGSKQEATASAYNVAEKISSCLAIAHEIKCEDNEVKWFECPGSLGVAVFDSKSTSGDAMRLADRAMYEAKEAGKGQIAISPG